MQTIQDRNTTWGAEAAKINTNFAATSLAASTYGGCIQRTLAKLSDYKTGMNYGKPIKIILIGDSITGGSWAAAWKLWMETEYSLPTDAIEIHWYGGYSHLLLYPFLDNLLQLNPDLIIYNEYEWRGVAQLYAESFVQIIRKYTTSDIAFGTWSMSSTELRARITDPYSGDASLGLAYYKSLSRTYNCELIDFNGSIYNKAKALIDQGSTVDEAVIALYGAGNTSVHLSEAGYLLTMLPEIKKHFGFLNACENSPYPLSSKEEIVFPWDKVRNSMYNNSPCTYNSDFTNTLSKLITSIANAELLINIEDAIGFELLMPAGGTGTCSLSIKKEGEADYILPSALRFKTYPLQFATEIVSITYVNDGASTWRMKRPFMKAVITDNINADGVLKSGQYKIIVTEVTLDGTVQTVKCVLKDPSGVQLGADFTVGVADVTRGNIYLPLKWNGENNWLVYDGAVDTWGQPSSNNYIVGDEYGFYVVSNAIDTINKANPYHKIFGFERGNYSVKIINNSSAFAIYAVRILH